MLDSPFFACGGDGGHPWPAGPAFRAALLENLVGSDQRGVRIVLADFVVVQPVRLLHGFPDLPVDLIQSFVLDES